MCVCVCVWAPVKYLHVVSPVTRLWLNLTPAVNISCGVVQIIDSSSLALVLRIKTYLLSHKRMAINSDFVSKSRSMKRKQERRRNCFTVGTWNIHTLVESTGDERVCRKRPVSVIKPGNQCGDPGQVDRKLDLVVRELRRYRVAVAGIQESKCF